MQLVLSTGLVSNIDDRPLIIMSSAFSWDHLDYTFYGDASLLEGIMADCGHSRLMYVQNKWGFIMQSARSGKMVWFERFLEHKNHDNDIVYVEFICPELPGVKLKVFND